MQKAYEKSKLCKQIMEKRNIKEQSCMTYLSSLRKIRNEIDGKRDDMNSTKFLHDHEEVMSAINSEAKLTTRKNRITAVLVALQSDDKVDKDLVEKYQSELDTLNDKYILFLRKQKKTKTQEKNWIEYEQLIDIVNKIGDEVKFEGIPGAAVNGLDKNELRLLQDYVMMRTYLQFPLRNDFAEMTVVSQSKYRKIPKVEREKSNYLVKDKGKLFFQINAFKNKSKLGSKRFEISQKLSKLIKLWLKHNKSGYFLVKTDMKRAMIPNDITKAFNRIFNKRADGKKISTSMLRHIIISYETRGEKTLSEKDGAEDRFMHSKTMRDLYRKVD
jgi:integrase